jgi:hypothetical protein
MQKASAKRQTTIESILVFFQNHNYSFILPSKQHPLGPWMMMSKCLGFSGCGLASMPAIGFLAIRSVSLMIRRGNSAGAKLIDDDEAELEEDDIVLEFDWLDGIEFKILLILLWRELLLMLNQVCLTLQLDWLMQLFVC